MSNRNHSNNRNRNRRPSNSNQNRNRNSRGRRGGSYRRPAPPKKPSIGQRILQILTLGLYNPNKAANSAARNTSSSSSSNSSQRSSERKPTTPRRKQEPQTPTSPKLYVGNLSYKASETELQELFSGIGHVQSAEIVYHRGTERSKGYGFVMMNSTDEAKRAVAELHDQEFLGRALVVSGSKSTYREEGGKPSSGSRDTASRQEDDEVIEAPTIEAS